MKLAIFADVHSNLPALQAVIKDIQSWSPDRVIIAGDLVNRGPRPLECLELIHEKVESDGWIILRGNHEDYVLCHEQSDAPLSGPPFEVHRASYWTFEKVSAMMSVLRNLPLTLSFLDAQGEEVRVTHASMRGIRDGLYPWMPDEKIQKRLGAPPKLFCVGHTHLPFVRQLDDTLVVNVGSAGLPFDGDIRPSYARLAWRNGIWTAEIIRVNYDMQTAERDFISTGYLEEAGPLAHLVLLELQHARSQLYQWAKLFQDRVLAGEVTMNQAVEAFLHQNY